MYWYYNVFLRKKKELDDVSPNSHFTGLGIRDGRKRRTRGAEIPLLGMSVLVFSSYFLFLSLSFLYNCMFVFISIGLLSWFFCFVYTRRRVVVRVTDQVGCQCWCTVWSRSTGKERIILKTSIDLHPVFLLRALFIISRHSDTVPCKQTVNNQTSTPVKLKTASNIQGR